MRIKKKSKASVYVPGSLASSDWRVGSLEWSLVATLAMRHLDAHTYAAHDTFQESAIVFNLVIFEIVEDVILMVVMMMMMMTTLTVHRELAQRPRHPAGRRTRRRRSRADCAPRTRSSACHSGRRLSRSPRVTRCASVRPRTPCSPADSCSDSDSTFFVLFFVSLALVC